MGKWKKIIVSDGGALKEIAPEGSLVLSLAEHESVWAPLVNTYLRSKQFPDKDKVHVAFNWNGLAKFIQHLGNKDL